VIVVIDKIMQLIYRDFLYFGVKKPIFINDTMFYYKNGQQIEYFHFSTNDKIAQEFYRKYLNT